MESEYRPTQAGDSDPYAETLITAGSFHLGIWYRKHLILFVRFFRKRDLVLFLRKTQCFLKKGKDFRSPTDSENK